MNTQRFRLIFSKSRGFLIPVAETSRAQRKPGQTSCNVAADSSRSAFFSLKRLAVSLMLASVPGWAFAQLIVDPSAGGTHVISAANGVPVIEIANPNGKGLSHNRFSEFDVQKPGVIFNNSQVNGVSQLGGITLLNPNLQRQATAILSEVTGTRSSTLSGTLEVFGGRADILIANPNGLSINGVTTLNSSSLTLSTGHAREVNGALQLLVDGNSGQVLVGAEGVNTEGLSYFDIVARSVALLGAVGSKSQQTDIQIVAGQGWYDQATGGFTATPGATGSGLAISGSAAGAMYGRAITLISSDSGVGVRHQGLILSAADIHINAAGDIELQDTGAAGRVAVVSTAKVTNSGTLNANQGVSIQAQELFNRNGGYLGTSGDLDIKLLGSLLNEQGATLLAVGAMALHATQSFTNAGGIQAGGVLTLSTDGKLNNSGQVRSAGLTVKAGSLDNTQGGIFLSSTDASFTVRGDFTNRSGAGVYAQQQLTLDVTGAVLNDAATMAANTLTLQAASLTNQAAAKVLADAGLDLNLKGALLNDAAVLAAKTLSVKAASLSNQNNAKLLADESVTLKVTGAVVNNTSTLASGKTLSVKATSLDNAGSAILASGTVTLTAADIRNRDSAKLQGTDITLQASEGFRNEDQASVQAAHDLSVDAETFSVTGGKLLAGNDLSLDVGTYQNTGLISSLNTASLSLKNNADLLIDAAFKGPQAANLFTLNAHDVTVTGKLNSPGSVLIKATGDVHNQGSLIVGKNLEIEAKGLIDNAADKLIWAGKNLSLKAGTVLTNGRDSLLKAMGDMALSAGQKVQNNTGRIEAEGNLWIDTPLLENLSSSSGGVVKTKEVTEDAWYSEADGLIERDYWNTKISLPVYGSNLTVKQAVIKAGGNLLLNQDSSKGKKATVTNLGGLLAATGDVLVNGNLENQGISTSKSLVALLQDASAVTQWSTSSIWTHNGTVVNHTLYELLETLFRPNGWEYEWANSLKLVTSVQVNQLLSAVLGADWKALDRDTLVTRWADFKANGTSKTQKYYADTQAEISAGKTFLHEGGSFTNGDGSNWKEQKPITVQVGTEKVSTLDGELDAQYPVARDGAKNLLTQQLGSPLFRKRESSGDGQAFERVKPLYETRIQYLDQSQFLGSQYFLDKIGYDSSKSVSVLGDAYFDHQLIVHSVEQRVGNFYTQTQRLSGTALVKTLLDNGASLAQSAGLTLGQPLTAAQVAGLKDDVVWYENQVVDGQTVLAPKLYLSQKTLAARAQDATSSALVTADTVLIDAESVTNFNGTVRGKTDTFVYSKGDINNISLGGAQAGFFAGDGGADGKGPAGQLVIAAEGLVRNQGGVMSGFQQTVVGGKGILSSATTGYDAQGGLVVRDNGRLGIGLTTYEKGPKDLVDTVVVSAEKPAEAAPTAAASPAAQQAVAGTPPAEKPPAEKAPLKVEAPNVRGIFNARLAAGPVDTREGSSLSLISGGDITLTSAITEADNVLLQTTGNLKLNDLHEARSAFASVGATGFLSQVDITEMASSANSVGNVLNAKNLVIQAQKDLTITGGEINAQNSDIRVGGDSKIIAGKDLAFHEKTTKTRQFVVGGGAGAGGYEATALIGSAPQVDTQLNLTSEAVVVSSDSSGATTAAPRVRSDVYAGRAAASQALANPGSTGAISGANKGRGGTNGANFKIGYQEVTTTDSTEKVSYRNAQLNLGSGSVDVGGTFDFGGADINAGYQLSPEARAKLTPEARAEASKNMPTLAISAGDIKTTKYEDSEKTKHTREEFFAGYTAEVHSSVLDAAGNASSLAHKALGKDVVNDPNAPKGSSKTLANEQKAMDVDPGLTTLAAAGMATQLAFGEVAGASSTYGIQHSKEERESSSRAENINQIGGNISLTSTKGNIELNGVNLQGGKVAINSAGSLTQRAAKSSTTSSEWVQSHTAGLTGSVGVSPTGAGGGVSAGASGNYDKTESSSTSYTNGLISGTEVSIETKGDHNLIGSNIKGNQVSAKIGGNQTITSVQDTSTTDHTRGSWSASVGVAVSSAGGIVPTGSASASGGKDYDNSKLVAEQAGIDADSLDLNVKGNLNLTGAHIVSKPGQGSVNVDGKITANTLHDSREKDGGYGGGGGGMSKNGIPTATLEGGRVDQVHYQADNAATIDVGDKSKVVAGKGIDGKLNSDASKQLDVSENRRVAGTDIKVEISVSDAKEIKAGVKKVFGSKAPNVHIADAPASRTPGARKTLDIDTPNATPRRYVDSDAPAPAFKAKPTFDQHVIVNTDSNNPTVRNAVDNLVAKHPDKTVVLDANLKPIQGELKPGGTAKVEVVGHGDGQSLGGLDGKQISDVVQKLAKDSNTSIDKLALVGCGTACAKDGKSLVNEVNNRLLEGGNNTQVKGYDGAVAVNELGRKQPTQKGAQDALGKGDPVRTPSPEANSTQTGDKAVRNTQGDLQGAVSQFRGKTEAPTIALAPEAIAPKRRWLERAKAEQLQNVGTGESVTASQVRKTSDGPDNAPQRVLDAVAGNPATPIRAQPESNKRSAQDAGLDAGASEKSSRTTSMGEMLQGIQRQLTEVMALHQSSSVQSQELGQVGHQGDLLRAIAIRDQTTQSATAAERPSSSRLPDVGSEGQSQKKRPIAEVSGVTRLSQGERSATEQSPHPRQGAIVGLALADNAHLPLPTSRIEEQALATTKDYAALSASEKQKVMQKEFYERRGVSARHYDQAKRDLDTYRKQPVQATGQEPADKYVRLPTEERKKMSASSFPEEHAANFASMTNKFSISGRKRAPQEQLKERVVQNLSEEARRLLVDSKFDIFFQQNLIKPRLGVKEGGVPLKPSPSDLSLSEGGYKALASVEKLARAAKNIPPDASKEYRASKMAVGYYHLSNDAKSIVAKARVAEIYGLSKNSVTSVLGNKAKVDRYVARDKLWNSTHDSGLLAADRAKKAEQNLMLLDAFRKRVMWNISPDTKALISASQLNEFFNRHTGAAKLGEYTGGEASRLSFSEEGSRILTSIDVLARAAKRIPPEASGDYRIKQALTAYMSLPAEAKSMVSIANISTLYAGEKNKGSNNERSYASRDKNRKSETGSVRQASEQPTQPEGNAKANSSLLPDANPHIDIEHPPLISLNLEDSPPPGDEQLASDAQSMPSALEPVQPSSLSSPEQTVTDVDALDSHWPAQVKLERDDEFSQDASRSHHDPQVVDVSDTEVEKDQARPPLKTEPDSPQSEPRVDPHPIVADAQVKEEVPVVRHNIDNSVPILQDEEGRDILLDALQPPQKNRQTNDLAELLARQKLTFGEATKAAIYEQAAQTGPGKVLAQKRVIKEQIAASARELALMSGEQRAKHLEHWMDVDDVPDKGRGVKAARDIPPFTVLTPYAGKLVAGEDNINAEWGKVGMNFTNYLFGTKSDRSVISAFGDGVGNISSLVNKGNDSAENNLTVFMLGQKLVYFMAERPIKAGEELLYDYGRGYDYSGWPNHPIQVQPSDQSNSDTE